MEFWKRLNGASTLTLGMTLVTATAAVLLDRAAGAPVARSQLRAQRLRQAPNRILVAGGGLRGLARDEREDRDGQGEDPEHARRVVHEMSISARGVRRRYVSLDHR